MKSIKRFGCVSGEKAQIVSRTVVGFAVALDVRKVFVMTKKHHGTKSSYTFN